MALVFVSVDMNGCSKHIRVIDNKLFIIFTVLLAPIFSNAQTRKYALQGIFEHTMRRAYHAKYYFSEANFIFIQSGDLGAFYGSGTFELQGSLLLLHFEFPTEKEKNISFFQLIKPHTDTLIIKNVRKRSFVIQRETLIDSEQVKYLEKYKRVKK